MRRLSALVMAAAAGAAHAQVDLDLSLSLNYAMHVHDTAPRSTVRGGQFNVKLAHDNQHFIVRGEGRLRWNDAYRSRAYSEQARDAYAASADWRELYIAGDIGAWNVSAGLQQVVWGKADNLRVVDQVNPVDLRDFIVPELNDYRIAVPMLRAARTAGDWQVELLYLPRFVPTRFARPGSEFDMAVPLPLPVLPEQRPGRSLRNGEFGMSASRSFGGLDLSGFLFQTWDDNPVYRLVQDGAAFQPEYRRQTMAGLALAQTLGGGFVLRSELAHVPNASYMAGADIRKSRSATMLLGLDYAWRDWLFSVQATDRHIARWQPDYLVRKHDPLYTVAATGSSHGGKLDTRISLARFANGGDGYVAQARTTWKPDDRWAYTVGADAFGGAPSGVFGRFRDKDRIWADVKYRF